MHINLLVALGVIRDTWQDVALVVLLGDRLSQRRRTRQLMAAINAEAGR